MGLCYVENWVHDLMMYWFANLCVLLCCMNASKNIFLHEDNHNACWNYPLLKLFWLNTTVSNYRGT